MRLIDVDALRESFGEQRLDGDWCICGDETTARDLIDEAPIIDAEPVRHGKWLVSEYEYFDCSECGESYYSGCDSHEEAEERLKKQDVYAYCPHCGAKMDGESETEK